MSYHEWGDDWEHWDKLYEAQNFVCDYVYKWTRCRVICKEKYGSIRWEYIVPPKGSPYFLRGVIRAPWKVRGKYIKEPYHPTLWCWNMSRIYRLWQKLGRIAFAVALVRATGKYWQVQEELTCDVLGELGG